MYCLSSVSGGAVAYLRNLAPLLAHRFAESPEAHRVTFLAHEEQALSLEGIEDSQIRWVPGTRPMGYRRVLWERKNLGQIVREQGADVLFTPYQIGPRAPGIRQVLMIRNMEPFLFDVYHYSLKTWVRNRLLRWASTRCLRRADRVIAVSEFALEQLTRGLGIDAERVRTIYHGRPDFGNTADNSQDRDCLGQIGIQGDYLLTCGSLLPYRRCEDVITAFSQCAPKLGAGMQLVIAGAGTDYRYRESIRKAIAASPARERIQAVGHVPWKTMATLYRHCTACVVATEIEACPNIAIEAMAAGCVIVSGDRPPLPEMFKGCALEYRARDIGQLAQQMRTAVRDAPMRQEMKAKALDRAEEFSWAKCAEETYAALTHWAGKRGQSR
jgi:glycosyltransferase involved in cell wall biosynthesis